MIESIYVVNNQAIEMLKLMMFIAISIPLFYVMFKIFAEIVKAIFDKD